MRELRPTFGVLVLVGGNAGNFPRSRYQNDRDSSNFTSFVSNGHGYSNGVCLMKLTWRMILKQLGLDSLCFIAGSRQSTPGEIDERINGGRDRRFRGGGRGDRGASGPYRGGRGGGGGGGGRRNTEPDSRRRGRGGEREEDSHDSSEPPVENR